MQKLSLLIALGMCLAAVGCSGGSKDPDQDPSLATHAPPPGPNADLHPPTNPNKKIPTPPTMGAPGGGTGGGTPEAGKVSKS